MSGEITAERKKDLRGRDISILTNRYVRAAINDIGAMTPELSFRRGAGRINTHWIPRFRPVSGERFDPEIHSAVWPAELLYEAAGSFPCLPNFGPQCEAYGVALRTGGVTAVAEWQIESIGVHDGRAAYLKSRLDGGREKSLPLLYTKYDFLIEDHPVHYTVLDVRNTGSEPYSINAAWHNTVGPPFLSAGCLIDTAAEVFATQPGADTAGETAPIAGVEASRTAPGAKFENLDNVPLRGGAVADLRVVPGMIGYSDMICGAMPAAADVAWSSVTNPHLKLSYVTFFRGASTCGQDEVSLNFVNFWMQYGGRPYTPWAAYEGGTDLCFALGVENATGAFVNGLAASLECREVLGRPTTVAIGPGENKRLFYGTALFAYDDSVLDNGIARIVPAENGLAVTGRSGEQTFVRIDRGFEKCIALSGELS